MHSSTSIRQLGRQLGRQLARQLALALILSLSLFSIAFGQSATATLGGTVVDEKGAVVAGATVTATNTATNGKRQVKTNESGQFVLPQLAPSTYTVLVENQGFSPAEVQSLTLNVNDQRSLNIVLKVGQVGATVQVTSEASLVDESPAVSTVIDRTFVGNLPLPGRSFQGLIALSPGVVTTATNAGNEGQFSVNGQRASSNAFSVDGVSANFGGTAGANLRQFASGSLPALSGQGGTNSLVSVDAVQEFAIQTSTYAAEFGRQPGAQVSIQTRSGTNKFQGSVFEYLRNDALDATDWFVNKLGLKKPPLRLNEFGGVFGGPLYLPRFGEGGPVFTSGKDRTFFFFSYEGLRLSQPQTRQTFVPTLAARAAAAAAIKPFLNAYPIPNGPVDPTDPSQAQFNTSFSDPSTLNTYSIRIDHKVNDRLQIFGRYNDSPGAATNRAAPSGDLAASGFLDTGFKTRTLTLAAISPFTNSLINDFRFNYSKYQTLSTVGLDNFGGAVPFTASDFFAGTPQPFTAQNGLFSFGTIIGGRPLQGITLGKNTTNTQNQINIVDNLTVVKGNHNLKFGVDYRRLSPSFSPREYVGAAFYFNFADAVANLPLVTVVQRNEQGSFFLRNVGLYAQDTWRASPRLTLTYGLRYELDYAPKLSDGLQPFPVTSAGFANPAQLAQAPDGTPLYKTTYNNFAPRVGVAYQLRQKAGRETVLRGGFGVFYDLASQYAGQIAETTYPPFGASRQVFGPGFCPLLGLSPATCPYNATAFPLPPSQSGRPTISRDISLAQGMTFFNPELKLPYSLQWNAAVEQSLGTNQTVSVSYVASRGYRLLQQETFNGNVNPTFNQPKLIGNTADSRYNSLQVQFQRRLSQGLQAIASYTFAHSVDTASSASNFSNTDAFSRSDPAANRGSSDFDVRHAFNAAVSYNIPAPFQNAALHAILGGWSVDSIFAFRTATPLTVVASGITSPNPLTAVVVRPDIVSGVPLYLFGRQYPGGKAINPAAFARPPVDAMGIPTRQGTEKRNAIRGFGAYQLDFALRREFKLGERLKLQFKGELFNILNHPNFGAVSTSLRFNAAGLPTPSATFGQATQMLGQSLGPGGLGGGFNPLFQIGGPRSTQLSLRLSF